MSKEYPKRLKRSQSFLGIHFDFHARNDGNIIGKNTDREMVEYILEEVNPDYVQCDCKGHPGISSYPTKVGHAACEISGDPLKIWREVTAERGVSLYMHYSGVWDNEAIKHHPSWARIDEKGKRDKNNTSVFGPYVDKLLIPQLKELSEVYGVDGVWIDGECWATCQDYGKKVVNSFRESTGIQEIPRQPSDPHFYEYTEFCREGFRSYLRHYVDEIHKYNPDFEIASNWAFTSFMPEPVTAEVDFISGDYSLQNSINSARLEGRCMMHKGKPWDLMAWSFSAKWGEPGFSTKSEAQLKQEAAVVLALGGGFQAYFTQKRDGSISIWQMKLMKEVAGFCRERQSICHRAEAVPQIALLYSAASFYRSNTRLFGGWNGDLKPMQGVLQCLLDSQNSVEILSEWQLKDRMKEYPLIVIPEWFYIEPDFKEQLLKYTAQGGKLLLVGHRSAAVFKEELDIEFEGEIDINSVKWLEHDGWLGVMKTPSQRVKPGVKAEITGKMYSENDNIGAWEPAATITSYGEGKIAATYLNFGERYLHGATPVARDFLQKLVRILFPNPAAEVKGSHCVDVVINEIHGKLAVNLVNTSGPHSDSNVYVYDEIPAVGPLQVTIPYPSVPANVTLNPGGQAVDYMYCDGNIKINIPRLDIHRVILVE